MKSRSRDSSMPDIALGLGGDPGGESSEAMKQAKIQRRGAEMALTTITAHFGSRLLEMIGKVWESMTSQLIEQIKPGKFGE